MNLEGFAKEFLEEALSLAQAEEDGEFQENKFTQNALNYLCDIKEAFEPKIAYFYSRGVKLNAWELNLENDSIDIYVSIFNNSSGLTKVGKTAVSDALKRGVKFLEQSMGGLHRNMEESSKSFDAAQSLYSMKDDLRSARIVLLTNCLYSGDVSEELKLGDVNITYHIWDVERFFQLVEQHGGREAIEINVADLKGGLPCVQLESFNNIYDSYLGIISGEVLANFYEHWGQRLLEQNVRAYLQTRNKVNKGILKTITNSPEMFLAYNNGISTAAESVEVVRDNDSGQLKIVGMKNFQIVNGGQTTASLYYASRKAGSDLGRVNVQFKLTVLRDTKTMNEHLMLISKYANSQSKVNTSDLSANHPFHLELEKLSRTVWAPNVSGRGKPTTKWYYERTRGQYISDLFLEKKQKEKERFKVQCPQSQKLVKTGVAKYEMSWQQKPHYVSQGGETNFIRFMEAVAANYEKMMPDERYFTHLVAKAILFKTCDDVVAKKNFGGHKANVVTYSIALLSHLTQQKLDLGRIWKKQSVGNQTRNVLSKIADHVWKHITSPPKEGMNIDSYCKKEYCWTALRDNNWDEVVLGLDEMGLEIVGGPAEPLEEMQNETSDDISDVASIPGANWKRLAAWGEQTGTLKSWERSMARLIGDYVDNGRPIAPKKATQGLKMLETAMEKGFMLDF
jgi:hypothetical protein